MGHNRRILKRVSNRLNIQHIQQSTFSCWTQKTIIPIKNVMNGINRSDNGQTTILFSVNRIDSSELFVVRNEPIAKMIFDLKIGNKIQENVAIK